MSVCACVCNICNKFAFIWSYHCTLNVAFLCVMISIIFTCTSSLCLFLCCIIFTWSYHCTLHVAFFMSWSLSYSLVHLLFADFCAASYSFVNLVFACFCATLMLSVFICCVLRRYWFSIGCLSSVTFAKLSSSSSSFSAVGNSYAFIFEAYHHFPWRMSIESFNNPVDFDFYEFSLSPVDHPLAHVIAPEITIGWSMQKTVWFSFWCVPSISARRYGGRVDVDQAEMDIESYGQYLA